MKSSFRNMFLCLTGMTALAGVILAGVYSLTSPAIAAGNEQARREAFAGVLGEFDNNPADAMTELDGVRVYSATLDGIAAGAAVEVTVPEGFGGPITLMVGFAPDGTLTGYEVLSHAETPGLGAKMQDWFSSPSQPARCVLGRNEENLTVSKDLPGTPASVDAITGATITSRAFLHALNLARASYFQTLTPASAQ